MDDADFGGDFGDYGDDSDFGGDFGDIGDFGGDADYGSDFGGEGLEGLSALGAFGEEGMDIGDADYGDDSGRFSWSDALQGAALGAQFGLPGIVAGGLLGGFAGSGFTGELGDLGEPDIGGDGGSDRILPTSLTLQPEEEPIMPGIVPTRIPDVTDEERKAEQKIRERARRRTGRLSTYVTRGKDLEEPLFYIPVLK